MEHITERTMGHTVRRATADTGRQGSDQEQTTAETTGKSRAEDESWTAEQAMEDGTDARS
jgi:hypothetical protein